MFTICMNSLKIAAFSGEHLVWLAHLLLSYSQPTKLGVQVWTRVTSHRTLSSGEYWLLTVKTLPED